MSETPITAPASERDLSSPLDGDESRRDLSVQLTGFRKWLLTQKRLSNPLELDFIPYWGKKGLRWPVQYSLEEWSERVKEYYPDEAEDVITYMIRAEAEWRAEHAAQEMSAAAYGVAPATLANKLSYRTGQTDDVCGLIAQDGKRCKNAVVPGSVRCIDHGGALIDPETRRAMLLSTYASLVTHAQTAVNTLVDVAENSRNDLARVSAAKEILDRVGLTPDLNINVTISGEAGNSPVDKLKKRLLEMSERLTNPVVDTHIVDADVIDVPALDSGTEDESESEALSEQDTPSAGAGG